MAEVPMIVNDKLETRMLVWDTISHQSMGKINTNEKIEIYKPYHSLFGYLFNDLSKATNQKDRCHPSPGIFIHPTRLCYFFYKASFHNCGSIHQSCKRRSDKA